MTLMHGDRATVHTRWAPFPEGWPATVMSHRDKDTWPTFKGDYCPNGPGGSFVLVRYDGWRDDEWVPASKVRRVFAPQDDPETAAQ